MLHFNCDYSCLRLQLQCRLTRNAATIVRKQYPNLVKTLPMDDEYFIAELYANDLLPGDLKNEIKSLTTSAKKAAEFLDRVIEPAVTTNGDKMFNTLLIVMRNSGNNEVIHLADNIFSMLNPTLPSSNTTGY